MNSKLNLEYLSSKGLLPFQASFALTFLQSKGNTYQELVAPTGLGKTRMASTIISMELERNENQRILIITPKVVLTQWQFELHSQLQTSELNVEPIIVDHKSFFKYQTDALAGSPMWPSPSVILMSKDVAIRDNVSESILETKWDLVVIDESRFIKKGKLQSLFDSLKSNKVAERAILLTSFEPYLDDDSVMTVRWNDIIDWNGNSIFAVRDRLLIPINYKRTEEEQEFLKEVFSFAELFENKFPYGKLQATTFLKSASSNIYAVEKSIRRLMDAWKPIRNKIAHNMPLADEDIERIPRQLESITDELETIVETQDISDIQKNNVRLNDYLVAYIKLESLLEQITEISHDSKLEALISFIHQLDLGPDKYVCILTSFASTAYYLHTNLEEEMNNIFLVTSGISIENRANRINAFREFGGTLIATDGALAGVDLSEINYCISYDLPSNIDRLEQRLGRFLRFGRNESLEMFVLVDTTNAYEWEVELLNRLNNLIL